jgi:transcription-repair coupling factor (superfamily II helicase)
VAAYVPVEHVPDEVLRVSLHARLGSILRTGDLAAVEAFADELEDRFGPAPEPLGNLLALARLSVRCRSLGIARLEVGPSAVAATPRATPEMPPPTLDLKNGRLLLRRESANAEDRLAAAEALLVALAKPARQAA